MAEKSIIKSVRIKFDKLLHDTGRAILVSISNNEYWLGYFMFNRLVVNKKLGGHFSISPKICDEKGIFYDESMVDVYIEKHIPEKIKNKNITPDDSLIR